MKVRRLGQVVTGAARAVRVGGYVGDAAQEPETTSWYLGIAKYTHICGISHEKLAPGCSHTVETAFLTNFKSGDRRCLVPSSKAGASLL